MSFGQIVLGPPGSGKTTYCHGMSLFLSSLGRKVAIVNLDPANYLIPYNAKIDISTLINLDDVIEAYNTGPNGGLIYCIEFLEKNIKWLKDKLSEIQDHYLLIDCPGQIELFTHHSSLKNILYKLTRECNHRLTSVHLVDSYYCSSPFTYLSALLVSMSAMLQIELPHVNVFSKIDLVERYGKLDFGLEYYAEASNLTHLSKLLENQSEFYSDNFHRLSHVLCDIIEQYSLVSFTTLNIKDKMSLASLIKIIDKSNGYIYTTNNEDITETVDVTDIDFEYFQIAAIQEKYMETPVDPNDFLDNEYDENDNVETISKEEMEKLLKNL